MRAIDEEVRDFAFAGEREIVEAPGRVIDVDRGKVCRDKLGVLVSWMTKVFCAQRIGDLSSDGGIGNVVRREIRLNLRAGNGDGLTDQILQRRRQFGQRFAKGGRIP